MQAGPDKEWCKSDVRRLREVNGVKMEGKRQDSFVPLPEYTKGRVKVQGLRYEGIYLNKAEDQNVADGG
jgi:hypothetical protein